MQKKSTSPRSAAKPAEKAAKAGPRAKRSAKPATGARENGELESVLPKEPHEVHIAGYKSIEDLRLDLGRVTVLIGENGSGKTNVLEAIAFAAAAAANRLEHEFLASRGVRTTESRFMRSAFPESRAEDRIQIEIRDGENGLLYRCSLGEAEDTVSPTWLNDVPEVRALEAELESLIETTTTVMFVSNGKPVTEVLPPSRPKLSETARSAVLSRILIGIVKRAILRDFLVFAPENTALRTFQAEGQILPLGVKGEGLFAHLRDLARHNEPILTEIIERLSFLEWFERFEIPKDLGPGERSLWIRDRYLAEGAVFDQRSANEGFLMLLFYLTLFTSPHTPRFFAVDNIDAALNPKLCSRLMETLVSLAKKHGKQAILTTHNPAVLDGLDLHDDDQRLYVIERDRRGRTRARRVGPPRPIEGEKPMKLSEAFLRGYIGGLPKNF